MVARNDPAYCEAYPRISVGEAWKSREGERTLLLFRNNLNHAVGFVEPVWISPERLVLHPHIRSLSYNSGTKDPTSLNIIRKGSSADNKRPYAECFACGRAHDIVVYAKTVWRCKGCLRLSNRTSILDEVVNISIEIEALEAEIGQGRPFRMRQKIYEQKLARSQMLRDRLGRRSRRSPDARYRFWVSGTWQVPGPFHAHLANGTVDD